MPLKGKYLKYSPEITLEIFTLIYNKLIENKWTSIDVMLLYIQFTKKWNYIIDYSYGKQFYSSVTNRELKETTVQEILGYNPFVKEEVVPEYVECINVATCNTKVGEIFKCRHSNGHFEWEYNNKSMSAYNSWDGWSMSWSDEIPQKYFKPSTKEAFDAQNKPIEKWSVGSYVVFLKDNLQANFRKRGDISEITHVNVNTDNITFRDGICNNIDGEFSVVTNLKWFATKAEAEEFAKTLVEPVKEEVKQPLKQAVHCTTQGEWDFVTEKLNYKWIGSDWYGEDCYINTLERETANKSWWLSRGYQLLSFQEWCDLNGYKMENEVKFETGKWYSIKTAFNWIIKFKEIKDGDIIADWSCLNDKYGEVKRGGRWESKPTEIKELSIEEIQQYLPDDHPDKIKVDSEFKVGDWVVNLDASMNYKINEICKISLIEDGKIACEGKPTSKSNQKDFKYFRHATPEEINNHLISIGQIPNLDNQESKIYSFKPLQSNDLEWEIKIPNPYSEILIEQSIGKLDKSLSIFPIFEENPLIQITKFEINKNYFIDFKDPYN